MGVLFALSLPGLVVGLILLASVERLGSWAGSRGLLPWRRGGSPLAATGFEELDAVLSSGKRLELEQRKSHSLMREDPDPGAPPRDGVDLDRGVVHVVRRADTPAVTECRSATAG